MKRAMSMVLLVLLTSLSVCAQKQDAIVDTIPIRLEQYIKAFTKPNDKGARKAVFKDGSYEDLISCSKTVYEYIVECKENNIIPSVAIRVRNGQVVSLIKLKKRYGRSK